VQAPADLARRARACANGIVARLDLKAGRTAAGLSRLLGDRETWVPEMSAEILDRFLIAETLLGMGREQEAESWYRSIADRGLDEIPFLAPSERRLGEIAERRGDVDAAIGHYREFVALWGHGDPEFRKQAEEVGSRVRAMAAPAGNVIARSPR
jgi:tetratricopeptide (TPR) repeat protein